METSEYSEMYKLEGFYWWFVARRRLLAWLVRTITAEFDEPVMLDVGCGTGMNYTVLSKYGEAFSTDMSDAALKYSKDRGIDNLVRSKSEVLGFTTGSFDVVTALDVLEHVDDDLAAMGELWRVTRDNGLLIVTVPAYGFLWSEHDEALHHKRRYAAHELRNKLVRAGFEVERISYYITMLFFPIFLMRIIQNVVKKSVHPKTSHVILPFWINTILIWLLGAERVLLRWINFPFGVSLVCIARKPLKK